MKKLIVIAISLFLMLSGCNNPRDIGEMLSERGYEYVSTIKIDSAFALSGKEESQTYVRCCNAEMTVDSLIKTIPASMTDEQKKDFERKIIPVSAAAAVLKDEAVDEDVHAMQENGSDFEHSGWLAYVKMKVNGKMDEYVVRLNKSRSKIEYIEPNKKVDYKYIAKFGYFDTYNPYMK